MIDLQNIPEQVQSGKIRIPRDRYGLRVVEATFGKSFQKQTPFLKLTCEICTPDSVRLGQTTAKIAGCVADKTFWLTDKAISRLADFHKMLGIPLDSIPDDEVEQKEYAKRYLGLGINALVTSKERPMTKEVDNGDGTTSLETIKDDFGNPIVSYSYEVGDVISPNLSVKVAV